MSETLAFRLAVIAAVVMLAISTLMAVTEPSCHPLPMSTLTAFELVRSVGDLQRIFGMPGDACRVDLVAQLDHANVIDTFAYIPAYTAFYALVAYALGRREAMFGLVAVVSALACAVCDVAENMAMFQLSAAPDQASVWLTVLIVATNAKWVGLAVVTTLCGVMLARRSRFGWSTMLMCAAPLATSLWAVADPDAAGQYLIPGMVVASVTLLAVSVMGAFVRPVTEQAPL
jgi:hypothetical protein